MSSVFNSLHLLTCVISLTISFVLGLIVAGKCLRSFLGRCQKLSRTVQEGDGCGSDVQASREVGVEESSLVDSGLRGVEGFW